MGAVHDGLGIDRPYQEDTLHVSSCIRGCFGDEKLWKGFAHLFRPRYAGANLGHPSNQVVHREIRRGDQRISAGTPFQSAGCFPFGGYFWLIPGT